MPSSSASSCVERARSRRSWTIVARSSSPSARSCCGSLDDEHVVGLVVGELQIRSMIVRNVRKIPTIRKRSLGSPRVDGRSSSRCAAASSSRRGTGSTRSPSAAGEVVARGRRPGARHASCAPRRSRSRRCRSPAPATTSTTRARDRLRLAPRAGRADRGGPQPAREGAGAGGRARVRARTPPPRHHNCSGKHAGMLALCRRERLGERRLPAAGAPVQRGDAREAHAEAAEVEPDAIPTATDGCGVVTFALPLERMAHAFSRLERARGRRPRRRGDARASGARRRPARGGHDRSCGRARLARQGRGRRAPLRGGPDGLGVALKVEDGNARAHAAGARRVPRPARRRPRRARRGAGSRTAAASASARSCALSNVQLDGDSVLYEIVTSD